MTLASIAGQVEVPVECLVVEQAAIPELPTVLPPWVRHLHLPPPYPEMPYSALGPSIAARKPRRVVILSFTTTIFVPPATTRELVTVFKRGFESARLQRFVFYLSERHTKALFTQHSISVAEPPLSVMQNCQGHTLAVERDVYFAVGGHDEAFLGWGGEDNELFDRLRTRQLHDCSYLPFLHLYHAPQPGKAAVHANTEVFRCADACPRPAAHRRIEPTRFRAPRRPRGSRCIEYRRWTRFMCGIAGA